ncbi:hypothetical protein M2272_005386 [Mycobacterium frederiksbergense]|uniref:DUF4229 domain-containing protein n=2 Tax=Mycolicibacterium frederiksbergense TaxID=117567 RepID=A0ABT6L702_9MYCO|nr:hypothetical protein [Mycolicibacterium frederiksbergense]
MVVGSGSTSRMVTDVLVYLAARLVLVAVLAGLIYGVGLLVIGDFPVVLAMLFALVIALPLGIWLFRPLRERATASIALVDERRRKDREQLQSRLRGNNQPKDEQPKDK